jgi:hypothetical protein
MAAIKALGKRGQYSKKVTAQMLARVNAVTRNSGEPIEALITGAGEANGLQVEVEDNYGNIEDPTNCDFAGTDLAALGGFDWQGGLGGASLPVNWFVPDNTLVIYFTRAEVGALTAQWQLDGSEVDFDDLPYDVSAPTATVNITYGAVNVDDQWSVNGGQSLHWGLPTFGSGAINWTYTASGGDSGKIGIFQFVSSINHQPASVNPKPTGTLGAICADGGVPYIGQWVAKSATYKSLDAPVLGLLTGKEGFGVGTYSVDEAFTDFFMYLTRTESGYPASIPVALGYVNWGWTASINWNNGAWTCVAKPVLEKNQMSFDPGVPIDWACTLEGGA